MIMLDNYLFIHQKLLTFTEWIDFFSALIAGTNTMSNLRVNSIIMQIIEFSDWKNLTVWFARETLRQRCSIYHLTTVDRSLRARRRWISINQLTKLWSVKLYWLRDFEFYWFLREDFFSSPEMNSSDATLIHKGMQTSTDLFARARLPSSRPEMAVKLNEHLHNHSRGSQIPATIQFQCNLQNNKCVRGLRMLILILFSLIRVAETYLTFTFIFSWLVIATGSGYFEIETNELQINETNHGNNLLIKRFRYWLFDLDLHLLHCNSIFMQFSGNKSAFELYTRASHSRRLPMLAQLYLLRKPLILRKTSIMWSFGKSFLFYAGKFTSMLVIAHWIVSRGSFQDCVKKYEGS